jgi:AcrR family transcriptional regulator
MSAVLPDGGEYESMDPRRVRSRKRLLDAATQLLATGGIEAVTVEAVTRVSKVARTTLYRNFGSSAELLAAAFERLIPQVDPAPVAGSLRQRLTELVIRQAVLIEQAPLQLTMLAWVGLSSTESAPPAADPPAGPPPALGSLRARIIERYRQPFDEVLDSAEGQAELGDLDRIFAFSRLLGPIVVMRLIGQRSVTAAECAALVDDFLAAYRKT